MRNDETLMRDSACGLMIDLPFPFFGFSVFLFCQATSAPISNTVGRELEGQEGSVLYF